MGPVTAHIFAVPVRCTGALSFSVRKEMPPVQLFQLIGGVVRAEPAIDEAAREAPIPAVFADHAVHGAVDFRLSIHNLTPFSAAKALIL